MNGFLQLMLLVAASAAAPAPTRTPAADAATSFDSLKALVGTWRAKRPGGRAVDIVYRLSAGGTVLVETWTLGPNRESMTLYHRDGGALLATHYCPIGNQPRLRLKAGSPRKLRFAYKDATDLQGEAEDHLHAFGLDLIGTDRIVRTETYAEGPNATETLIFDRVP